MTHTRSAGHTFDVLFLRKTQMMSVLLFFSGEHWPKKSSSALLPHADQPQTRKELPLRLQSFPPQTKVKTSAAEIRGNVLLERNSPERLMPMASHDEVGTIQVVTQHKFQIMTYGSVGTYFSVRRTSLSWNHPSLSASTACSGGAHQLHSSDCKRERSWHNNPSRFPESNNTIRET